MIDRVQVGSRITAAKTNELVDAANKRVKQVGGTWTSDAQGGEIMMPGPDLQRNEGWAVFREPFDLSAGTYDSQFALTVVSALAHVPDDNGQLVEYGVPEVPMTFPSNSDKTVYMCELSSGGLSVLWTGSSPSPDSAVKKRILWKIGGNGVVQEDLRAQQIGGGEAKPYGTFQWRCTSRDSQQGTFDGEVRNCYFQFGRAVYSVGGGTYDIVGSTGGDYYLNILHDSPAAATLMPRSIGNSLSTTSIPIFSLNSSGEIERDYRGMPTIPVWGSPTT